MQDENVKQYIPISSFDTAWVPPNSVIDRTGLEELCVANPRQIKVLGLSRGHEALPDHLRDRVVHSHNGEK